MEESPKVKIKGIREGLLISVGEESWSETRTALLDHLQGQAEFLRGGRLILDVGNQVLRAAEMGQLRDMLSDNGLSLWAVLSNSPVTQQNAQSLGLATRINQPPLERTISAKDTELTGENAVLVQRTLRSGFSLQHSGHITVIGDVNPGAEIIAGGNVVVWGRLSGMVHAGAEGDNGAVVCALALSPTQLRIAGHISVTPSRRGKQQPEIARLIDGQVVAEPWKPTGK
jgi:septum site-determining protein MinC